MSDTAIYARFSAADMGDSVAGQVDLCREWLTGHGAEATRARIYSEDRQSAYAKRLATRPQWSRLVEDVRAGRVRHIVVRHVDRITRSTRDMLDLLDMLEETGCRISTVWSGDVDVTTTTGRQIAKIAAVLAEGESETKSERVRAAKARRRSQGRSSGGRRRFGYTADDSALAPEEADLIRDGIAQVLDGVSLASLARQWNATDVSPIVAKEWSGQAVRGVLVRWRNAGRLSHDEQDAGPAEYPAIVPVEDLQAARAILLDPTRRASQRSGGRAPQSLLTGIVTCGACGGPLKAASLHRKGGGRKAAYRCGNSSCGLAIEKILADELATDAMTRFYMSSDPAEFAPTESKDDVVRMQAERSVIAAERKQVSGLMGRGLMAYSDAEEALEGIAERQRRLDAEIEDLQRRFALASSLSLPVVSVDGRVDISQAATLRKHFLNLHLDVQRKIFSEVWEVTVCRSKDVIPQSLVIDGKTVTETLTQDERQRRRVIFTNRLNPAITFDLTKEALSDITPDQV